VPGLGKTLKFEPAVPSTISVTDESFTIQKSVEP